MERNDGDLYRTDNIANLYVCEKSIEERIKDAENVFCPYTRHARLLALEEALKIDGKPAFPIYEKRIGKKGLVFLHNIRSMYTGLYYTCINAHEWVPRAFKYIGTHCEVRNLSSVPLFLFPEWEQVINKDTEETVFYMGKFAWVEKKSEKECASYKEFEVLNKVVLEFEIDKYSPNAKLGESARWEVFRTDHFVVCNVNEYTIFGDYVSDIVLLAEDISTGEFILEV